MLNKNKRDNKIIKLIYDQYENDISTPISLIYDKYECDIGVSNDDDNNILISPNLIAINSFLKKEFYSIPPLPS